jgi:hypothetical protein
MTITTRRQRNKRYWNNPPGYGHSAPIRGLGAQLGILSVTR